MPALTSRGVLRRLHRDERGAVATIVALLLAMGVLLGMMALVIDVGQLYAEREELQSGADAAAIAVTQECVRDDSPAGCSGTDMMVLARTLGNLNARDGRTNILEVCGTLGALDACGDPIGNLTDCIPATPTDGRPYVEVRTGTEMRDGDFVFPPTFAQALAGNGAYEGTSVRACARATIGTPGEALGVTFSQCEWTWATNNGAALPPGPQFVSGSHKEIVLKLHDSKGPPPPGCPAAPGPNADAPGGFGFLDRIDCQIELDSGTYPMDDPGNDPGVCLDLLDDATTAPVPQVLFIPIYQSVKSQGQNTEYTLDKVAAFVPTGYFFGAGNGKHKSSWLPGSTITQCNGQERCIYGYFVDVVVPGELGSGDVTSLGATVIALSG